MSTMKTAISIEQSLFKEMEDIAKEWHLSRSELFARAAQEFIEKQKNLKMLNKLNKIYAVGQTEEERKFQKAVRKHTIKVIDTW